MKNVFSAFVCAALGIASVAAQSRISQLPPASADAQLILDFAQLHINLQIEAGTFLTPPMMARAFSIVQTCVYDAWAAYDNRANPTFRNNIGRRSGSDADVDTALAYAAYRCLESIFAGRSQQLNRLRDEFTSRGFDPDNETTNTQTPQGVGNVAAATVLQFRVRDGSNQLGNEPNSATGLPYSDHTNYFPGNPPEPSAGVTDCSQLRTLNKWQPLLVPAPDGSTITQRFASPQADTVLPFALNSAYEIVPRVPGPPLMGTSTEDEFIRQFTEVRTVQETLDDTGKVIAEYWEDGAGTALPPGHWHRIAIEAATLEQLNRGDTVKFLYAQSNAAFDAGLASWAIKRYYDSVRPVTAIRCLFEGERIVAWRGFYQGVGTIDASAWTPYQSRFVVSPPFAEYTSGHSTFSASSAEVFRRWFGDDSFRGVPSVTIPAGESRFEPRITSGEGFIAGVTDVPNRGFDTVGYSPAADVTLSWATWTEAADEAGNSRLFGGIHIAAGNEDGKSSGTLVGAIAFRKARKLWTGAARSRNPRRTF